MLFSIAHAVYANRVRMCARMRLRYKRALVRSYVRVRTGAFKFNITCGRDDVITGLARARRAVHDHCGTIYILVL